MRLACLTEGQDDDEADGQQGDERQADGDWGFVPSKVLLEHVTERVSFGFNRFAVEVVADVAG